MANDKSSTEGRYQGWGHTHSMCLSIQGTVRLMDWRWVVAIMNLVIMRRPVIRASRHYYLRCGIKVEFGLQSRLATWRPTGAGAKQAQLEKRKSSPNSAVAGIRTLVGKLQDLLLPQQRSGNEKKTGSFSLIERVILSAGAMLIFSVYFHLTKCPEGHQ